MIKVWGLLGPPHSPQVHDGRYVVEGGYERPYARKLSGNWQNFDCLNKNMKKKFGFWCNILDTEQVILIFFYANAHI